MSPYIDKMRLWAWRLAVAASLLVAILAAVGGAGLIRTVMRTAIAWLVIYGLAWASIKLFEQTASPPRLERAGRRIDVAVGLEDDGVLAGNEGEPDIEVEMKKQAKGDLPGQVNPELAGGLGDSEKQAEIVRRMGWGQQ